MFAPAFAPEMASENIANAKLGLGMVNSGWDVIFITQSDPGYMYAFSWEEPWCRLKERVHVVGYEPKFKIIKRIWLSLKMRYPAVGVRWVDVAVKIALNFHRKKPFDFVISRSLPEYSHLAAMVFKKKTGVPWLANWNDPVNDCWPMPYKNQRSRLNRTISYKYLKKAASKADFNTFPCQRLSDTVNHYLDADKNRCEVIPHIWLDGYHPPEHPENKIFKLCHAGNLSEERDPTIFLNALKRLVNAIDSTDRIIFTVIGVDNAGFQKIAADMNLTKHVRFTGGMGYMDSLNYMAAQDVLVIIEAPCEEGIFLPGKLADYAQSKKPILALSPKIGTVAEIISGKGGGIFVDCTSEEQVFKGLRELYIAWHKGRMESYVSQALIDSFSPRTALTIYETLFKKLKKYRKKKAGSMGQPHVIICIPVLVIGGTEIQTLTLAKVLMSANYRVTVCCYYEYDELMVSQFEEIGVKVIFLKLNRKSSKETIFKLIQLLKAMIGLFKKEHPDIVHVQYMAPGFIPIFASRLSGIPTIFATVHHPGRLYGKKERSLLRLASRLCSAFFCVSRSTEESWFGNSHVFDPQKPNTPRKHHTIYNAVDIDLYDKTIGSLDRSNLKKKLNIKGMKTVGIVSRLRKEQGHAILLEAMKIVIDKNNKAVLLAVGDGPDRKNLKLKSVRLGISDHILWLGRKTKQELIELYGIIDVLAVPSFYEGFGLVAAEAMAASVPVVASDIDALREVVDHGTTGYLFEPGDKHALSKYLTELLDKPSKAKKMGKKGRQRVENNFSMNRFALSVVSAYKSFS